ncbi:hypothetical protein MOP44_17135 [Occallatibacter riparius]|uniref:Uncharacterized protein n=1 Tax=Occallatibacter riparius TaxID=1002689 RepID=A0A9J7BN06_9BACT|nr:hypothetical protein [Occallatibacter riparius]UWZ82294.1 hypothetical protein MOP44_17135 [Occallatibacter riparius]
MAKLFVKERGEIGAALRENPRTFRARDSDGANVWALFVNAAMQGNNGFS